MTDINNNISARIDRFPLWPYKRLELVVIGASFLFSFFDIVTSGFALPVMAVIGIIAAELVMFGIKTTGRSQEHIS